MTLWQRLRLLMKGEPIARSAQKLSLLMGGARGANPWSATKGVTYREAVEGGYKGIVWVYRCVKIIGESVGSVPWKVYQMNPDGTTGKVLNGHPLEKLIKRPNPWTDRKQFFETWSASLDLSGNCYWEIVPVQGKPGQLFTIRPDWMSPIPDPVDYVKGYKFDPGGNVKPEFFEPKDIIHFKFVDPLNEFVGMSPLTAAARTLETEHAAISWNKTIFDNSAVPNGVLSVPAATMLQEDKEALQQQLETEFTRDNLNRPMVLWGGMEWKQLALSHSDMSFLEQRRLNKYEICAVYGVPPPVVGANEDPTYSNWGVARLSLWEDTVIPRLDWLQTRLNNTLVPYYGSNIELRYDVASVPALREAFTQKVKTGELLWKMGYPINAVNRVLGLGFEDVPWGDTTWMPSSMVPVMTPNIEEPREEVEEEDDDPYGEERFGARPMNRNRAE